MFGFYGTYEQKQLCTVLYSAVLMCTAVKSVLWKNCRKRDKFDVSPTSRASVAYYVFCGPGFGSQKGKDIFFSHRKCRSVPGPN